MGLVRELSEWRSRRRRFRDEWAFHRDMAISEFESLGLTKKESRRYARRRLGSYYLYRRSALRSLRADCSALLDLLPWRRIKAGWLFAPAIILAALAVVLAPNPHRIEVLANSASLLPFVPGRHVERLVPLTPAGVAPMGFADITLWCFGLIGLGRVAAAARLRRHWRVWLFASGTLLLLAMLGGVLWATILQLLLRNRWASDGLQGLSLGAFAFLYVGWAFGALRLWYRDLLRRCPVCLRRLGMADVRGNAPDLLVDPLERETICLHGHGANIESRWRHTFEAGPFTAF